MTGAMHLLLTVFTIALWSRNFALEETGLREIMSLLQWYHSGCELLLGAGIHSLFLDT